MPSDFSLALAHYRIQFPDAASLGAGAPPVSWKAEYDRVANLSLGQTLVTSTGAEGANVSAIRNFDQTVLLRALHARRAELDDTYDAMAPTLAGARPMGITVRM